jgi:hypothetical protein
MAEIRITKATKKRQKERLLLGSRDNAHGITHVGNGYSPRQESEDPILRQEERTLWFV